MAKEESSIMKTLVNKTVDDYVENKFSYDKSPVSEEIVVSGLSSMKEFMKELEDPQIRKLRLSTIQDAKALSSIIKEQNEILRVEQGKANSFVKHEVELSLDQTKKVFSDLRRIDPVFDYPLEEEEEGEEVNS